MNMIGQALGRWNKEYTSVLLTVALPVTLQNAISIGLNLVDVMMIGRLGEAEVAAVGAANRIYGIFGMLCFGLLSGFSVYIAQYWGKRDIKNIRRVFGLALSATSLIALIFMALAAFAGRPIMHLFVREAPVLDLAQEYINIALFSYPLIALSFSTAYCSRSIRRLRATTLINGLALGLNTLLNYGLIFGNLGLPRLGVSGAAIATVIARALELCLLIIYVYASREHPLAGHRREFFSFDRALSRQVLRTALPVLMNEGAVTFGFTSFFVAISFLGTSAVAVMQVSMVVNDFFFAVFYGMGNAVAVLTGNELGRGQRDYAYDNGKAALWLTLALGLLMGAMLLSLRGFIVGLYGFEAATSTMLSQVLLVRAWYTPPRMLVFVSMIGLLRAGGDTRFCMLVDVGSICLIGVPLSFIGVLLWHWQLPAVLALLFVADIVGLVCCMLRFRSKVWINTLV